MRRYVDVMKGWEGVGTWIDTYTEKKNLKKEKEIQNVHSHVPRGGYLVFACFRCLVVPWFGAHNIVLGLAWPAQLLHRRN